MGLIPEQVLEQIRDATDIVDLVSSYVTLKRSGVTLKGLCPFHQEKTPSFYVYPEKRFFKCYGCGEAGSVFDFLMKVDGLAFPDAVEMLAGRLGIEVVREEDDDPTRPRVRGQDIFRLNEWAAKFFRQAFRADIGRACRDYLQGRGIDDAMVERFGIGYGPAGWDTLLKAAHKVGIGDDLLEAGGLVRRNDRGLFDLFADRLMFPIVDSLGRYVGFGGRSLDGREPKYVNSPESPIFSKSRTLYAVDSLKGMSRDEPVLVMEGYTDVIMSAQVDGARAVATLGTSLTEAHARILARYTDQVILVFDGDAAGRKAAERGVGIFSGIDVDLRVSVLAGGQDPCDFLLSRGAEGAEEIVAGAIGFLDFVLDEVAHRHDLGDVTGKSRAAEELLAVARSVVHPVKRGLVVDRVAQHLGVDGGDLRRRLSGAPRGREATSPADTAASEEVVPPINEGAPVYQLLVALVNLGENGKDLVLRLKEDDFTHPTCRRIAALLLEAARSGFGLDHDRLLLRIDDPELRRGLARMVIDDFEERRRRSCAEQEIASIESRRGLRPDYEAFKASGDLDDADHLLEVQARLRRLKGSSSVPKTTSSPGACAPTAPSRPPRTAAPPPVAPNPVRPIPSRPAETPVPASEPEPYDEDDELVF